MPRKIKIAKSDLQLHEKCQITFAELGALLALRTMLASGLMVYTANAPRTPKPGIHKLYMGDAMREQECGTVGCIGGYMKLFMGGDARDALTYVRNSRRHPTLCNLFWPHAPMYMSQLQPAHVIAAIDSFLNNNGKVDWDEACKAVKA